MQIITGKTDTTHVRAEDDRALHAGIIGTDTYILNVGSKFAATIETANNITIADGELVFQGTHARIRYGETDTCIIENGTTGYNRIDLIVARYTQTAGLEKMELAVIKGEATSGTPNTPVYTEGNILEGALLAEIPMYTVEIHGVNVISVTSQLPVITTTLDNIYTKAEIDNKIATINSNINTNRKQIDSNIAALDAATTEHFGNLEKEQTQKYNDIMQQIERNNSNFEEQINEIRNAFRTEQADLEEAIENLQRQINELKNKI